MRTMKKNLRRRRTEKQTEKQRKESIAKAADSIRRLLYDQTLSEQEQSQGVQEEVIEILEGYFDQLGLWYDAVPVSERGRLSDIFLSDMRANIHAIAECDSEEEVWEELYWIRFVTTTCYSETRWGEGLFKALSRTRRK